ncbi:MAG: DUF3891 family protein [Pirellulales bacterium]
MIRRDVPALGGKPAAWMLIPQIEHAHLAGRLAEHWGAGGFAPLEPMAELLWAVFHHDDGWRAWDDAPGVDPARGVPRAFTEMEIDDSLAIWSGSTEIAHAAGNLQGYVVAGHFCALARRGAAWRKADRAWPRVERFLAHYEGQMMPQWLAAWQSEDPRTNTLAIAAAGLAHLQFFDSLSLWFCCAEATTPDTVTTPSGGELLLDPRGAGRFWVSPWPFAVEELNLEVAGRMISVGHYPSREALAAAPAQPALPHFQLQPAPRATP